MKMKDGIYLIVDPSMDRNLLLNRLNEVIKAEIAAVQIWDNFKHDEDRVELINEILKRCKPYNIPVLINNDWELMKETGLDGVHFDTIPQNIFEIKNELRRDLIYGITVNNDLSVADWANENDLNYISFCSMFPSSTANSCELVSFENVKKAREETSLSIFLAGGIKPEHIEMLNELDYSGIAVVSGIMNSDRPVEELKKYQQKIKHHENRNN